MLHLENMQKIKCHSLLISSADHFAFHLLFNILAAQRVGVVSYLLTCLQAAHIWSINFSRLVQRAARKAAVLPGVGKTALPGAPKRENSQCGRFFFGNNGTLIIHI